MYKNPDFKHSQITFQICGKFLSQKFLKKPNLKIFFSEDGCAIMFNDDIGGTQGGLFHYQSFDGFRKYPTEYYFRPYYTYIYKELGAFSTCINGEFLIPKWLDVWER